MAYMLIEGTPAEPDTVIMRSPGEFVLMLMAAESEVWRRGQFREVAVCIVKHACGGVILCIETLDDIPISSLPCPWGDGYIVRYTEEFPYPSEER